MSDAISDGYKLNRGDRRITVVNGRLLSDWKDSIIEEHHKRLLSPYEVAFLEMINLYEAIHAPR